MRVRAWLAAALIAASVVGAGVGEAAGGDGPSAGRKPTVKVTGVLERLVVDSADGSDTRYAVHGGGGSWWLDGLDVTLPPPGSIVEVTGAPSGKRTLMVTSIRVTTRAGGLSALGTAATPRTTKVLVLRVYWGAAPPARPTAATAKKKAITDARAWFQEVSHGRYTVSGSVTPWLRVPRPRDCYAESFDLRDQALVAARRAGFRLSRYGRFIYYLPCSPGGLLGFASLGGGDVWLFNTLDLEVVVHEQGHNLGLRHASSRVCTSPKWAGVTWSPTCEVNEYGDELDAMGNRRAGHYNAYFKSRLGWLQRSTTVTSTRTVTLAPYETTGPGIKAIRLRTGLATYWLEYRTRTGADRAMPRGTAGVQLRVQTANRMTQLLDGGPGSTIGHYDFADVHLPAGSSWTTPQKVRITVTRQTSSAATVAIKFAAGAPKPPNSPAPVRAQALVNAARITWARPADNGAIVRAYRITRSDGASRIVTTFAGLTTSYTWQGLDPSRSYRFSVRAINQAGVSAPASSPAVQPRNDIPSVVIDGPDEGATVAGVVPIQITATPNPYTRSPIHFAELYVDGALVDVDHTAPWGPFQWDTRGLINGPHTIGVSVWDQANKVAGTYHTVTVGNPAPTVTVLTPIDGHPVAQGEVDVAYTLAPTGWSWDWVSLWIDGSPGLYMEPGDRLWFATHEVGAGLHTLRVRAGDEFGLFYDSPEIHVTVPDQ